MSSRTVDERPPNDAELALVRTALDALRLVPKSYRGLVLCWFCNECRGYVGPGRNMTCEDGHHA